jgi:hypothetical protein
MNIDELSKEDLEKKPSIHRKKGSILLSEGSKRNRGWKDQRDTGEESRRTSG